MNPMALADKVRPETAVAGIAGVAGVAGLAAGLIAPWRVAGRFGLGIGVAAGTAGIGAALYFGTRSPMLPPGVHHVRVGKLYKLDASSLVCGFDDCSVVTAFDAAGEHYTPAPPGALAFSPSTGPAWEISARWYADVSVMQPGVARVALIAPGQVMGLWVLDTNGGSLPSDAFPLPQDK